MPTPAAEQEDERSPIRIAALEYGAKASFGFGTPDQGSSLQMGRQTLRYQGAR
jgi:hypothetical protein